MESVTFRQETMLPKTFALRDRNFTSRKQELHYTSSSAAQGAVLDDLALAIERLTSTCIQDRSMITPHQHLTLIRSEREKRARYSAKNLTILVTVQGTTGTTVGGRSAYSSGKAALLRAGEYADWDLQPCSSTKPFLALAVEIESLYVWEVAEELGFTSRRLDKGKQARESVLSPGLPLLSCLLRTVQLLTFPESLDVLYTGIAREICYWLFRDNAGIQRFQDMMEQGRKYRVTEAVHHLHRHFKDPVCVQRLATVAGMSPATLHRHFKNEMAVSPHQYLKRLRLQEARRLIALGHGNVKSVAFDVGYESVSHFSREFTRMFGLAPGREREATS